MVLDLDDPARPARALSEGLAAAGGATVRFDGRRVAFVGREREDAPFAVFTCASDGGDRARVPGEAERGGVAFLGDGRLVWSESVGPGQWALFVGPPNGAGAERITFSGGIDADPAVLPDGRVAFASRPPGASEFTLLAVHADGTGVGPYRGRHRASALRETHGPVPLAPFRRPQGHLSVVDAAKPWGDVFCVDARPPARLGARPPGEPSARAIRFWVPSDPPRPLRDAPVESDGSFFARLPADAPIVFDVLGDGGIPLGGQRTPFWLRPGETRGCVGCHEEPDSAPPNVRPLAVLADPTPLAPPPAEGRR